MYKDIDLMR